jgi:Fe-S cluster assembly protein SufB
MSTATETIESLVKQEYKYGFITDVESESAPPGLNEDIIRLISLKKKEPQWLTDWRLKAYRHWLTMAEPTWQFVKYPKIDFQDITYYSAPKQKTDGPKSLDEVDPKLLETYEKLGIPLRERGRLAGVAVDAVFDSVSVGTTYRAQLMEKGHHFLFVQRGGAGSSRLGEEISRIGGAVHGQLLRHA